MSEADSAVIEALPISSDRQGIPFEGIIAKQKGSCYVPGRRTSAWVKYKLNQCEEFVIGGYTPGNPFDALIVGCYDGPKGMETQRWPHVRREVFQRLRADLQICRRSGAPGGR